MSKKVEDEASELQNVEIDTQLSDFARSGVVGYASEMRTTLGVEFIKFNQEIDRN